MAPSGSLAPDSKFGASVSDWATHALAYLQERLGKQASCVFCFYIRLCLPSRHIRSLFFLLKKNEKFIHFLRERESTSRERAEREAQNLKQPSVSELSAESDGGLKPTNREIMI